MGQKSSKSKPKPELSVVIVTPDKYQLIRSTIRNLRKQTATKQMEIVIVTSSKEVLGLAEQELKDFLQFQVVEAGKLRTRSKGAFLGIRSAKAPVVTLLENHCYAEPEWAEALIEAHKQPWAAVGPVVANANPQTINSYVNFCMFYNSFITPIHGREVDSLPWHNTAYKKEVLQDYGSELEYLLGFESLLQEDLIERGQKLYLEQRAKIYHVNISKLSSNLTLIFYHGRMAASRRAQKGKWSFLRRLLYICAVPLFPLINLRRLIPEINQTKEGRFSLARIFPMLFGALLAHAFGELVGFAIGEKSTLEKLAILEFYRYDYLAKEETPFNFELQT